MISNTSYLPDVFELKTNQVNKQMQLMQLVMINDIEQRYTCWRMEKRSIIIPQTSIYPLLPFKNWTGQICPISFTLAIIQAMWLLKLTTDLLASYTVLFPNLISTGCTGNFGRNAPCLKLINALLFVVVPILYTVPQQ